MRTCVTQSSHISHSSHALCCGSDHLFERRVYFTFRGYVRASDRWTVSSAETRIPINSYFVTELLGTDLHRLLTSRPLEKQFIQYFLYQILVSVIYSRDASLLLSMRQRGLKFVHSAGVVHRDLVRPAYFGFRHCAN